MFRTSSYTIYVDLPDDAEQMLLVHGYTGSYDLVSRPVATYLRSLEKRRAPKPLYGTWSPEPLVGGRASPPSDETIGVLRTRGYLTSLSYEEEEELFTRIANSIHEKTRTPGYIFVTNYDCNLRCPYCFQSHMREDESFKDILGTMRPAMVERIFRAIPKIEEAYGVKIAEDEVVPRSFGLFGGEPLLASARPIVDHIFEKANEIGTASFYTITNGTEIDAFEDLIGPDGIRFLQITLDGPPEEHDQRRVYADGSGSFERIADNISMALERGATISIRLNVDKNNVEMIKGVAREVMARGWHEDENFSTYAAAIRAENDHTDPEETLATWGLQDLMNGDPELKALLEVVEPPDDRLQRQASRIFNRDPHSWPAMKATFCAAHNGMHIFDAFGSVYTCWERLGEHRFRIGHVDPRGDIVFDQENNKKWRSRNITTNPACLHCRYALYCGGGCAMEAEETKGKFFINACDDFNNRFRASVARAYGEFVQGVEPRENFLEECER